jgi:xanthosine utilization system XapX-like protein
MPPEPAREPPAATLPFRFDTGRVVQQIMAGVLALVAIAAVGVLYSLLVSRSMVTAVQLVLIGVITAYLGHKFLRNLTTSTGIITAESVDVEPAQLLGVRLAGASGRFPLSRFDAVRVDRITLSTNVQVRPHARVYLAGRSGTPDILIARTSADDGRTLGNALATAIKLPYQEQVVPY